MYFTKYVLVLVLLFITSGTYSQKQINQDVSAAWDTVTPLQNPYKGWYIHYYDNRLDRYGKSLAPEDQLKDLKGLNHVYLRLGWCYLEPEEGRFNWPLIDSIIDKWTARGCQISFRISCKETSSDQVFATPEWVKKAGVKGSFAGKNNNWEPDYGDPIFLEKLENFHRAFAKRYGDQPYLAYVDIGSFGDWGEGHTIFGTKTEYPASVIKKHIDIYKRCYPNTLLMISDDFITSRNKPDDATARELLEYIRGNGIAWRDDSVCVKFFTDHYGFSTLRSQYLFDETWRTLPGDLELEHYQLTKDFDTWKNGKPLEAAIREAHATYVGFHGEPRQWMQDNPGYADRLINHIGYWYFIKSVQLPVTVKAGQRDSVSITWLNRGVAPAYRRFALSLSIISHEKEQIIPLSNGDNRTWMPDSLVSETYHFTVPDDFPSGSAKIGVRLIADMPDGKQRVVELGMRWKNKTGFYHVGKINVLAARPLNKKKIVFLGDSITQEAFGEDGYASVLKKTRSVRKKYELIGEGVGGNRIGDLVKRQQEDVLVYKPDKVVLFVGVNDCGWPTWHPEELSNTEAEYEQSMLEMVKQFQQRQIEVIICTPALIGEKKNGGNGLDKKLDRYADICRRVAASSGSELADIRTAFTRYLEVHNTADQDKGILTVDGVHPNRTGSELIAQELSKVIK